MTGTAQRLEHRKMTAGPEREGGGDFLDVGRLEDEVQRAGIFLHMLRVAAFGNGEDMGISHEEA